MVLALIFSQIAAAQIRSIGVAGDGEFTRITLASDHDMNAGVFASTQGGLRAIQVVPSTYLLSADAYLGTPTGGVSAYTLDDGHIVFELDRPMMVMRELDLPPTGGEARYRLVLDLVSVSETRFAKSAHADAKRYRSWRPKAETVRASAPQDIAAAPSPKPWSLEDSSIVRPAPRHKIAIDPGHGGRDPGAPVVTGGEEKSIVLQTSLKLQEFLEKDPRYDVMLTRTKDVYVEHEDRVSMAREWGADLFISVHADAALKPDISGASVYTISTRGERRIEGTAVKYGWEIPIEGAANDEVEGILTDLVKRETKSNSAIFADFLVSELAEAGPLLRNTHRQGNLFVLLAPDVPAVLVEIGFLSNKQDARRLKSSTGRRKSAEAIKRAIDTYFDRQELLLASN